MYRIHHILLLSLFMVVSRCLTLQRCKSPCNGLTLEWVNTFCRRWKQRCSRWGEIPCSLQQRLGRAATLRQLVSGRKEKAGRRCMWSRQHWELEQKQKGVCQDRGTSRGRTEFQRTGDFTSRNVLLGPWVCCPANHYQSSTIAARNSCLGRERTGLPGPDGITQCKGLSWVFAAVPLHHYSSHRLDLRMLILFDCCFLIHHPRKVWKRVMVKREGTGTHMDYKHWQKPLFFYHLRNTHRNTMNK